MTSTMQADIATETAAAGTPRVEAQRVHDMNSDGHSAGTSSRSEASQPTGNRIVRKPRAWNLFQINMKTRYYAWLLWHNPWLLTCNARVRNYVRYKLTPHRVVVDTRKTAPVFCSIPVTQRCNLSCSFCIVGDWINEPTWRKNEATVEQMDRLLDHAVVKRCLYIMLAGGEPLLNRDIIEIVRRVKSRRHLVGMTTNGVLLGDRAEELRRAGLDLINVSLYDDNKDALADILPIASKRLYCKLIKVIGRSHLETPGLIEECVRFTRETGCGQIYFQNMLAPPPNSKTMRKAEARKRKDAGAAGHADPDVATRLGGPESAGTAVAVQRAARSSTSLSVIPEPDSTDTEPIYDDDESYPRIQEEVSRKYPDVRINWPAPVLRNPRPDQKRCRMPWYFFLTDIQGNQGFCCAHATCSGPNIFELPDADVFNTDEWTETRKGLLSADTDAPSKCDGCFMLNDTWSSEM